MSTNIDWRTLRAPRANHGFCTDKERIRTETTVLDKGNSGLGLPLHQIAPMQRARLKSLRLTPPRLDAIRNSAYFSNSAIDSTCEVCGNMLITPAAARR